MAKTPIMAARSSHSFINWSGALMILTSGWGLIQVPDTPLVNLRASMELPPAATAPEP